MCNRARATPVWLPDLQQVPAAHWLAAGAGVERGAVAEAGALAGIELRIYYIIRLACALVRLRLLLPFL